MFVHCTCGVHTYDDYVLIYLDADDSSNTFRCRAANIEMLNIYIYKCMS